MEEMMAAPAMASTGKVPVRYGAHPPVPAGAACEACGTRAPKPVTDHCHKHGWVRGTLCAGCNTRMAFIDRLVQPGGGDIGALLALARRCPECPPLALADLAPTCGNRMRRGRPQGPERVALSVRILADTDERLTAAVEVTEKNPQSIVDAALAEYLARLGF